ncbi:MAG: enoyl-CoA hydratase-related protein, partial [Alphaproteobacteria bacterium]
EAARWGLVNRVVAADRLMETAREMADTIAESAPLALQALLEVMQAVETLPLAGAMAKTKRGVSGLPIYEKMLASDDYFEGPRAFAEKRKPVWKGR